MILYSYLKINLYIFSPPKNRRKHENLNFRNFEFYPVTGLRDNFSKFFNLINYIELKDEIIIYFFI